MLGFAFLFFVGYVYSECVYWECSSSNPCCEGTCQRDQERGYSYCIDRAQEGALNVDDHYIKNGIYFNGVNVTKLVIIVVGITLSIFCICTFALNKGYNWCNKKQNINGLYGRVNINDNSDVTTSTDSEVNV